MRITISGRCSECGKTLLYHFEIRGTKYNYRGEDCCDNCGHQLSHQEIERLSSIADKVYSNVLVLESLRVNQISVDFTAGDHQDRLARLGVI